MFSLCLSIFVILISCFTHVSDSFESYEVDCSTLRIGQYVCPDPEYDYIDPKTQQPWGCTKDNKAKGEYVCVDCVVYPLLLNLSTNYGEHANI